MHTRTIFHNPGTLDIRAFTKIGLSAKDKPDAIGYFGTGLNNAIAVILRHGATIRVFTDGNTYRFNTQPATFRNKEYGAIYYKKNNEQWIELPFTLHYGANWKLWQAYRELYTNAIDEGGGVFRDNTFIPKDKSETYIIVDDPAFAEIASKHDEYFLSDKLKVIASDNQEVEARTLHPTAPKNVYVRGVAAHTMDKRGLYTYNIIARENMLTEDRTLSNYHIFERMVQWLWVQMMGAETLRESLLSLREEHFEYHWTYTFWSPSDTFMSVVKELIKDARSVPAWAIHEYHKRAPKEDIIAVMEVQSHEAKMVQRAVSILNRYGLAITYDEIKIAPSLPNDALGLCFRGDQIYLSHEAIMRGEQFILSTLYEEALHKYRKFQDTTRRFQDYLLEQNAALMLRIETLENRD